MQNYKYSLADIEYMIPWEREIYLEMLMEDLKQQRDEAQRQSLQRG